MKNIVKKIVKYIIVPLLIIFVIGVSILFIPSVQKKIINKISLIVESNIDIDATIRDINISPFGFVDVEGITVKDYKKDTILHIKTISTFLYPLSLLSGNLSFMYVNLDGGFSRIKTYENDSINNALLLLNSININPNKEENKLNFNSSDLSISNFSLEYENEFFKDIKLDVSDIYLINGDYGFNLKTLNTKDSNEKIILQGDVQYVNNETFLTVKGLDVKKGKSNLKGDISISFNKKDLQNINLKGSIDVNDFKEFTKHEYNFKDKIDINISSKNSNDIVNINLGYKSMSLISSGTLKEDNINFNIKKLEGDYKEVQFFLDSLFLDKNIKLPLWLLNENKFHLSGNISKIKENYTLELLYDIPESGNVKLDAEIDSENNLYAVDIETDSLLLSKSLNHDKIIILHSKINIKGEDSIINIKGYIDTLMYDKLIYNDVSIISSKSIDNIFFDIRSKCKNFNGDFYFNINDFEGRELDYEINLKNSSIHLNNLNYNVSFNSKGNFNINSIENINGNSNFDKIVINNNNLNYLNLIVNDDGKKGYKNIKIQSDNIIDFHLRGLFSYNNIGDIFINSFKEYIPSNRFNYLDDSTDLFLDAKIKKDLLRVFSIKSNNDIVIKSDIYSVKEVFNFSIENIDSIEYNNYYLENFNLKVNKSKDYDVIDISIDSIYTIYLSLKNLTIEAFPDIEKDTLYLNFFTKKGENNFHINTFYNLTKDGDGIVLNFNRSKLKYDESLLLNTDNKNQKISYNFKNKELHIDTISINDEKKSKEFLIYGAILNGNGKINAKIKNIPFYFSDSDSELTVSTIFRGDIGINIVNEKPYLSTNLWLDSLKLSGIDYGNTFINIYDNKKNKLNLNLSMIKDDNIIFNTYGSILKKDYSLRSKIEFNDFDIKFLNSIPIGTINGIRGNLFGEGDLIISKVEKYLTGKFKINDGGLGVPYLNIDKDIDNPLNFEMDKEGFILDNINLYKKGKNVGLVNGRIDHTNFKLWNLDLDIDSYGARVFNLDKVNVDGIYGEIYAEGNCKIFGFTKSGLNFDVNAKTNPNSKFYLNIDKSRDENKNIISFKKKILKEKEDNTSNLKTIKTVKKFKFDIDVNENLNTVVYLIDGGSRYMSASSNINVYGNGKILISANTGSPLNLYGKYNFTRGSFDFNVGSRKKFQIKSGSNISCDGDIKNTILDINTTYKTNTNINRYILSADNSRYEILLGLNISDDILSPVFDFDIDIPFASQEIKNELSYKLNEANQKQSQFFGLLAFNTFIPSNQDEILINTPGIIGGVISSQVSNLANKIIDSDVDINLKYLPSLDNNNAQNNNSNSTIPNSGVGNNPNQLIDNTSSLRDEVELGLSKKIFSDRISLSGAVGVPISNNNYNGSNSLSSDIQIEANISKNNKWKAEIFNRQEPSILQSDGQNITQGVGISYRTEFYSFWDFLKGIFTKKKNEENK